MAGACLTQFTVIGLLFAYGVFFKSFETEFGWSRTLLSSCTSLAFIVMGALAVAGGRLSDRYGPRLVLGAAGIVCGAGFALMSQVTQPWHMFVAFGLLVGIGMSTHDVVTLSTIARWFDKRRGMMTGIVKVGTAAGQVVVPPAAALMLAALGWRPAVVILGAAAAVLLVVAAAMMRKPPDGPSAGESSGTRGFSFAEARRNRILWMLCAIQFLYFPTLTTIPLHIVVHGMDLGMTAALAATLLSVVGATSVLGRLAVGTLADRIGGRNALILCFIPLIASLLALMAFPTVAILFVSIAIYGFAHGGFFTVMSPTVAEYFGLRAHGTLFGFIVLFGAIGAAVGPIVAGAIFDLTASYTLAFATLALLAAAGLVLTLLLPRPVSIED